MQFKAPGTESKAFLDPLLLHGAGGSVRRIADYRRYASELAKPRRWTRIWSIITATWMRSLCSNGVDMFEQRYPAWAKMVGELAEYLEKQPDRNGKAALVGFSNGGILATGASTLDPKITVASHLLRH